MRVSIRCMAVTALAVLLFGAPRAAGSGDGKSHARSGKSPQSVNARADTAPPSGAGTLDQKPATDKDFIIGPNDVLSVNVWREPEVSQTVTVLPDGKISLPLAGEVVATGLTTEQLESAITRQLENYLSRPKVTVIVHEVKSQRIVVAGEVAKPGSYELLSSMTVLDAISQAGGPLDYGKVKSIYVLRKGVDGRPTRIPFNYKQVIKGRNLEQNVTLEPHDTVVVP